MFSIEIKAYEPEVTFEEYVDTYVNGILVNRVPHFYELEYEFLQWPGEDRCTTCGYGEYLHFCNASLTDVGCYLDRECDGFRGIDDE